MVAAMAAARAAPKVGLKGLMKDAGRVVTKAYSLVDVRVDLMVVWKAAKRAGLSAPLWVGAMAALTAANLVVPNDVYTVGKRAALWVGN